MSTSCRLLASKFERWVSPVATVHEPKSKSTKNEISS